MLIHLKVAVWLPSGQAGMLIETKTDIGMSRLRRGCLRLGGELHGKGSCCLFAFVWSVRDEEWAVQRGLFARLQTQCWLLTQILHINASFPSVYIPFWLLNKCCIVYSATATNHCSFCLTTLLQCFMCWVAGKRLIRRSQNYHDHWQIWL